MRKAKIYKYYPYYDSFTIELTKDDGTLCDVSYSRISLVNYLRQGGQVVGPRHDQNGTYYPYKSTVGEQLQLGRNVTQQQIAKGMNAAINCKVYLYI